MTGPGPTFDDLVGDDLVGEERARLIRVHELLIEAGPPPELRAQAPVIELRPRRRRGAVLAVAAALTVAVFAVGVVVGNRTDGRDVDFIVAMSGTGVATSASAALTVFELDDAGNWPMEIEVHGLAPTAEGRPFELWLTRAGERTALCGNFLTNSDGFAVVPMNAPYPFKGDFGWVVVEEGSSTPLLTT